MMGLSQLLIRRREAPKTTTRILPLRADQGPVYAVGDVHGCKSHLLGLLKLIQKDAASLAGDPTIVLLGDVIDRGPDSAGVLEYLAGNAQVRAILGNHERMMMSFLAAPKQNLGWLDLGGFETLLSYGLVLSTADAATHPQRRLMQMLATHVPQTHLDWLAALPHGYRLHMNGEDFLLVHAGYDPTIADSAQHEDVLIWGRHLPLAQPSAPRRVQGHKTVHTPDPAAHCIQIDTGAWQTGRLSALRLVSGCSPRLVCYSP
jgi:serine/threonine protein phosphatase 1